MLARCTGDDRWYPTVDLLFRNQPRWARAQDGKEGFLSVLSMTGLKEADLEACLSDQALLDKVNAVAARGQELGVKLVARAVAFARENKLKIRSYCSYAEKVLTGNPDYQDVVLDGND